MAGKKITQVVGNAARKPEKGDTQYGPVVRVSVAVTKSYPSAMGADDGETRWVQVSCFKESIGEQMLAQIDKGTVVIAEGVITEGEYQGKPQYAMKASRVGLGSFFLPSAADKAKGAARAAAAPAPAATADEW